MPRSSSPRAALPPTDHVARELLKRGARDPAMQLLRAAVRRDPGERACAALIKALDARPDAAVSGPELTLDLALIDDYVARGMLLEARAVLAGAGLDVLPAGAERARDLDELLSPTPRDAEPALVEALLHVMTGGASLSLSLLEEHVQQGHALPPWAERSRSMLRRLLLDDVPESAASGAHPATAARGQPTPAAAPAATVTASASGELALAVGRLISERDLRGAAARLEQHCASAPSDAAAAAGATALRRLVRALDVRDGTPAETVDLRTMPMGPQKVADLNLRMGNLPEAERLYRRVLLDEPENVGLRAMLDDVQAVRRFLDPPAAIAPTPLAGVRRSLIDAAVADIAVRPTEPLPVTDYDPSSDGPEELPRMYTDIAGGAPTGPDTGDGPTLPDEVTRRVLSSELARAAAGTLTAAEPPAQRPSSPGLSKKRAGPSSGGFGVVTGYGPAKSAAPAGKDWDDDATGILEPAVEAELLLKQGFPDRALRVYRMLAEMSPASEKFRRRVHEIEALIASERAPMPGDLTVRRDVSDLQRIARPTAVRVSVPEEALAAAASMSAAALPGTLDARGGPLGQFDDEPTNRVALGRDAGSAADALSAPKAAEIAPPGDLAVQVTRIVVVR